VTWEAGSFSNVAATSLSISKKSGMGSTLTHRKTSLEHEPAWSTWNRDGSLTSIIMKSRREAEKERHLDGEHESSKSARVTTRVGDDGYTSLLGPDRVPKYSSRPSAFGTLDEASSVLGLARALCPKAEVKGYIYELQKGLYTLMAELATPASNQEKVPFRATEKDVERLEEISNGIKKRVVIGQKFVVPGETICGATLDVARTVIRRGERLIVRLAHDGEVENAFVLAWVNRLSDVVFVLARFCDEYCADQRDNEGSMSSP
jgi:cob(I)alamin adenosyltransferase